jgi:hypothetical protein
MNRLYVVVRSDLEPGAQLAQACHALSAWAHVHRAQHDEWQAGEQNLVVLSIPSENALGALLRRAITADVLAVGFHEPDFGHELTAAAFSADVSRMVSSLPLALRAPKAA